MLDGGRVRLIFEPNMPDEVAGALLDIFLRWAWVIPTACDEIRVFFDHTGYEAEDENDKDDPEIFAACESLSEYHAARIHVYPRWLTEPEGSRERIIVHELGHIITAPLAEVADFVAERCSGDPLVRALVAEHNRRACESTVTDLEKILLRSQSTGSTRQMT